MEGLTGKNILRTLNSLNVLSEAFDLDEKIIDRYLKDRIYKDVFQEKMEKDKIKKNF